MTRYCDEMPEQVRSSTWNLGCLESVVTRSDQPTVMPVRRIYVGKGWISRAHSFCQELPQWGGTNPGLRLIGKNRAVSGYKQRDLDRPAGIGRCDSNATPIGKAR